MAQEAILSQVFTPSYSNIEAYIWRPESARTELIKMSAWKNTESTWMFEFCCLVEATEDCVCRHWYIKIWS